MPCTKMPQDCAPVGFLIWSSSDDVNYDSQSAVGVTSPLQLQMPH